MCLQERILFFLLQAAERIMSFINHCINGCVFDCFHFDNPLNSASITTDVDLEKANFEEAMSDMFNIVNGQNVNAVNILALSCKQCQG